MQSVPLILATVFLLAAGATLAHEKQPLAASKKFDASEVQATAFGQEGDPAKSNRTIRVLMSDQMRFEPATITVRRGDTVRFVVANKGAMFHEMVLGTADDLARHAQLMKKFPGMQHEDANIAHVQPGATGQLVWQFTQRGEFEFACLVPGHYEAGMVGKVVVK